MRKIKGLALSLLICFSVILSGCNVHLGNNSSSIKDSLSDIDSSDIDSSSTSDSSSVVVDKNNKYCFWEVSSKNSDVKLYLFGSIHAADDTAYPLPDSIMNAYNSSKYLAVECDIIEYQNDYSRLTADAANMIYSDGSTVKDHLDKNVYEGIKKILEDNGQYMQIYDYMRPYAWMSLVDNVFLEKSGLISDKGLDNYFLTKAKKEKKAILEIESAEFQMQLLSGFSDELMNLLLKSYVEDPQKNINALKDLYANWKAGDLDKILQDSEADDATLTAKEKALVADYNKKLLTDRNKSMADKAEQYMNEKKTVFYVVGAAHMCGDDGIVSLLEKRGYTVKRL